MKLLRLQLFDYRNFLRIDLALGPGPTLFVGDNAQGKSNLLVAVYLLATTRDPRAEVDAQLIRRSVAEDVSPTARVLGEVETAAGSLRVEVGVLGRPGPNGLLATKVARVNGVPRRLSDVIGRLTAVLFTAEDIDLVGGPRALRRRYLDITLSQVDRAYLAARQRLERVLLQRNHLLKRIREGAAGPEELAFWDAELARDGGYLFRARAEALLELGQQEAVEALQAHWDDWIANPERRAAQGRKAREVVERGAGAAARTAEWLVGLIGDGGPR